ncbi:hypothetical protein H7X87_04080 [Acetobacteraceae bacterium]|nr:hypothetical protein [Candidatus Parcubacteria bacterium]
MDDMGKPAWPVGRWWQRLLLPAIIVLVAVASFGLGRLSALKEIKGELVIHQPEWNL